VECSIGGFNINPKSTCPSCKREYLTGGCGNKNCELYQSRERNKENHKKEQQKKKDDYKKSKKEQKNKKK